MGEIKAGVVVVTRFCNAGAKAFSGYIAYIDREDAKRQEYLSEYNLYNDYMDNPEKTTGLFTDGKSKLTLKEKKELKDIFATAQENDSLMWQTVISFDNRWLSQYGLYDENNQILDERKLKELATGAINKMLENEKLQNAVWSGAIHYNTDNVHIHIATVEPIPERERKEYIQYKEVAVNGKHYKEAILNEQGREVRQEEYVGTFKQSSIDLCKKYMVDNIIQQKEQNILLNKIIREQIVKQKKTISIATDADLKDKFLELHSQMPRNGNRGLWNYNNNVMKSLRPLVDEISMMYINKYHPEEYKRFREILLKQSDAYKTAYGQGEKVHRDFEQGKIDDLFSRLGNSVLQEMREFDKNVVVSEEQHIDEIEEKQSKKPIEQGVLFKEEQYMATITEEGHDTGYDVTQEQNIIDDVPEYFFEWSKDYKEAKRFMYGNRKLKIKPDYARAFMLLKKEAKRGNALAVYDIGDMYAYGRGMDIDKEKANMYYAKAFEMFKDIYNKGVPQEVKNAEWYQGYVEYRIAKHYNYGLGVEKDYTEAKEWFTDSSKNNNKFAHYSLGNIYYYGLDTEQNYEKAAQLYEKAEKAKGGNGYASYKLGEIWKKGLLGEPDIEKSKLHYSKAFAKFIEMDSSGEPNDNLKYKIGMMLLRGEGTEQDEELAKEYLEVAADAGNSYAQYQLAQLYIKSGDIEELKKAIELLEQSAIKGKNSMAMYSLGKIYSKNDMELYDIDKAESWWLKADQEGNSYAAYNLGKIYNDSSSDKFDKEKAIVYLEKAAKENNEYAQYSLGKIYLEANTFDSVKARKYLTMAAEQGNVYAQYTLGKFYLQDGYKDMGSAIGWLTKAVEQNNEYAQYTLGKIYLDKELGVYDVTKGIGMLAEAAGQGNQYAQLKLGMLYVKGEIIPQNRALGIQYLMQAAGQGNEYAVNALLNMDKSPKIRIRKGKTFAMHLEQALNSLKKSLKNEIEKWRNIREYEKLMESMHKEEKDSEYERE